MRYGSRCVKLKANIDFAYLWGRAIFEFCTKVWMRTLGFSGTLGRDAEFDITLSKTRMHIRWVGPVFISVNDWSLSYRIITLMLKGLWTSDGGSTLRALTQQRTFSFSLFCLGPKFDGRRFPGTVFESPQPVCVEISGPCLKSFVWKMDEFKACILDYFPENILIDVLSYLSVREIVRAGR